MALARSDRRPDFQKKISGDATDYSNPSGLRLIIIFLFFFRKIIA